MAYLPWIFFGFCFGFYFDLQILFLILQILF